MKKILIVVTLLVFLSCENKITQPDIIELISDDSGLFYLPADQSLANQEVLFVHGTVQGGLIVVLNGNGRAVGVDIRHWPDTSQVYAGYGYIGQGGNRTEVGVVLPSVGDSLLIRVFTYKTIGESIIALLDSFGSGFFDKVQNTWVDGRYRRVVVFKGK